MCGQVKTETSEISILSVYLDDRRKYIFFNIFINLIGCLLIFYRLETSWHVGVFSGFSDNLSYLEPSQ